MSIASMPVGQAPDQVLQQALHGMVPEIKPYEALAELNSRVKSKQLNAAQQGAQSIQQALQLRQQPTIAQTLMQQNQALDAGIGQLNVPENQSFASGGIVAFADGGSTPYGSQEEQDRARIISELEGMGQTVGKLAAAGYDVFTMPVRALAGVYNTLARGPRAFGIPLPFVPKEFGTESMTPIYDKYFRGNEQPEQPQEPATWGAETRPNRPVEPQRIVPPSLKDEVKDRVASVTRTGKGSGGGSAKSALQRPVFDLTAPEYESPEARDAASFAAESGKLISPRMSEYDQRMKKYRDKALAMQRGEGIDRPSRLKRGIDSALAGATDEVMAARRAGIRPSLGMALAGAGKAASASDKEYKDKLVAMQEKGFEREFALEQARIAYQRGQEELGQRWEALAEKRAAEIRAASNASKDKQFDVDKMRESREMDLYQLDRQAEEKAKDRATTLAAASMRGAGGNDDLWRIQNVISQRFNSNPAVVQAAKIMEGVAMLPPTSKPYQSASAQATALKQQAAREVAATFAGDPNAAALAKQVLSGMIGTAPGATPGVAPTRVIDFSTIK